MDPLATLAHRLASDARFREEFARGHDQGLKGLTGEERAAVAELQPLLAQAPDKLAESLRDILRDTENWPPDL
jgi:hypothetical protein